MQPFDHLIDLSSGVSGDVRLQLLDDVGSTNLQDAIQGVDHL